MMECSIRQWKISDAGALATALNNVHIQDNLRDGLPFPYTIEDAKEYIQAMLVADKKNIFAFAIVVEDIVVGSISVTRQENIHCLTAEMGYCIAEPYWGKGYATSAIKQVSQYVFRNSDIQRIFAEPFAYNIASCKALEKSGFVYEGTLRKNAIKNGQVLDMVMYSLLASDISKQ